MTVAVYATGRVISGNRKTIMCDCSWLWCLFICEWRMGCILKTHFYQWNEPKSIKCPLRSCLMDYEIFRWTTCIEPHVMLHSCLWFLLIPAISLSSVWNVFGLWFSTKGTSDTRHDSCYYVILWHHPSCGTCDFSRRKCCTNSAVSSPESLPGRLPLRVLAQVSDVIEGEEEAVPGGGKPGEGKGRIKLLEGQLGQLGGARPGRTHAHHHGDSPEGLAHLHGGHSDTAVDLPLVGAGICSCRSASRLRVCGAHYILPDGAIVSCRWTHTHTTHKFVQWTGVSFMLLGVWVVLFCFQIRLSSHKTTLEVKTKFQIYFLYVWIIWRK